MDACRGRWALWYAAIVLFGFALLYFMTRSPILIGDAGAFIRVARLGDPALLHYGEPSHLLQVVIAGGVWRGLDTIGVPVSLEHLFVGISLIGTLAAVVFSGLIASELLAVRAAAWVAAVLLGTSLHVWTQVNGELYGLALGFATAGLFLALRGRIAAPAFLWALSVMSHSEFVLAAPAFVAAVWMARPAVTTNRGKLRGAAVLLVLAAVSTVVTLLVASYAIGKWSDAASLLAWLQRSYATRQPDVAGSPEVVRAIKGLLTAYTVGGHYWRDILTGRGVRDSAFLLAAASGFLVLGFTFALLAAAVRRWRAALFALTWLLPFHLIVNWWFVPTVEKYHAGALPGFVLLVTAGVIHMTTCAPSRTWRALCAAYIVACAGLNLFGSVLPMQAFGQDAARAEREIRQLRDERGGKPVFIACDDPRALVNAGGEFFRLRSFWKGSLSEVRQTVRSWTQDRVREGKEPYLVGRWCLPEEWKNAFSTDPFDLFFLEESYRLVPTRITGIPIAASVPTNPFSWTRGDVFRLESKEFSPMTFAPRPSTSKVH